MPYTALADRRMPYDNDGTVFVTSSGAYTNGASLYPSGAQLLALNGYSLAASSFYDIGGNIMTFGWWWFFPESREVTGLFVGYLVTNGFSAPAVQGSNDSTNGLDGTWETASITGTLWPQPPGSSIAFDVWRSAIRAVSFTGPKKVLRIVAGSFAGGGYGFVGSVAHVYGEKAAGQTPDDIIYINHDDTPGAEYTAPEDFGDQPLGTTVVRQFRVKNASATKTANTINIQCNDADFAISTDNVNWVVTINLSSLAAGAESPTYYVRCTTPGAGSALGPRYARIVTTVASYT